MPKSANLVQEESTSTGTGNFTLSNKDARQSFNDAYGTSGSDVFWYFIMHRTADEWEVGTGSMSDSTTLVRDTVVDSSNSGSAVNFSSGTKDVTSEIASANQVAWYRQTTAPTNPDVGDVWFNTERLTVSVYYDDGTDQAWVAIGGGAGVQRDVPQGHIYGLTLSNNGTDANHDIDIAVGEATDDSSDPIYMKLTSALTKQADATFAAGDDAGGSMDSGTLTADGTVHWWLISSEDGTTVDVACSDHDTSGLSPTLPTGYTRKRWIGALTLDGSGNLDGFTQYEDYFQLDAFVADVAATNPGTSAVTRTLSVPEGVTVMADTIVGTSNNGAGGAATVLVTALTATDDAPAATQLSQAGQTAANVSNSQFHSSPVQVMTNTSAQVRSRLGYSDGSVTLRIYTRGWYALRRSAI